MREQIQKLYIPQYISSAKIDKYLSDIAIRKLKETDKNMLDEFPSNKECTDVVNNMKKETYGGLEDLLSEYYQTFKKELGFTFYEALNDICNQTEMSSSQKLLVISSSLLFKKDEKVI